MEVISTPFLMKKFNEKIGSTRSPNYTIVVFNHGLNYLQTVKLSNRCKLKHTTFTWLGKNARYTIIRGHLYIT